MLKNVITKISDTIQWTKKWHFFHVLFVPSTIFAFLNLFISILLFILDVCSSNNIKTSIFSLNHLFLIWGIYTDFAIIFFILAVCVQILFSIINWIKYNNIQLQNQFLLRNKKYNFLYCTAFYCNVLYIISLLILIMILAISLIFASSVADKIMY